MSTQKPKFAVLGNLPADLAQEVSSAVDMQPSTSAVEEIHGLLIHGPTATPDLATFKQYLEAGKILTFHQPTDEHLSHLLKLVGFAPGSSIPMVSCFKDATTQHCTVVKGVSITSSVGFRSSDSRQDSDGEPVVLQPSLAGHLNSTLTEINNPAPSLVGLVPPLGAPWGKLRVIESGSQIQLTTPVGVNNIADDLHFPTSPQPGSSLTFYADYYVYWTNGNDGADSPSFYVIRYDNGSFAAGNPEGYANDSQGYFNGMFQISPVTLTSKASTLWSTDGSFYFSPDACDGSNPVYVFAPSVELCFYLSNPASGGYVNTEWTPGINAQGQQIGIGQPLNLPGWAIARDYGNLVSFYQEKDWNTHAYPWQTTNWNNFFNTLFRSDYKISIVNFPDLSRESVAFAALWAWQFYDLTTPTFSDATGYPKPTSCPISVEIPSAGLGHLWYYFAYYMHGQAGCNGNGGSGIGNHFWFPYYFGGQQDAQDSLDLATIVKP